MQLKPILTTVIGLMLAGGSLLISEGMLSHPHTAATAATPNNDTSVARTVTLIAAGVDIPFGAEITREMLRPVEVDRDQVPEGAFDDAFKLLGTDGTPPRSAVQAFRTGDLILTKSVSRFGETVTLTRALPDGQRAVAIKVSAETAVGGFVAPGDRVDIVLTEGRGASLRTGTILQDVRVLGIDQNADETSRGAKTARTITVEVTPRGGQILALSQQAGILSLTLRNDTGLSDDDLEQITMADVWGIADVPVEPSAEPVTQVTPVEAPTTIRVRRGVTKEDVVLQ